MARHQLPRKAKRSPLAAAGNGSGNGGLGSYSNNPNRRPSATFFPADDEGPSNGRGSGDGAASNGRSPPPGPHRLLFCVAVVLLSSVLAALYHLAVTLPDQYSHAGGALYSYAGRKSRNTNKQQTAKIQPNALMRVD